MRLLWIAPLLLAGCAQEPQQPLSPEQRAVVMQMLMQRQAAPQPYQVPMPAPVQLPQGTSCTTIPIGGGQYRTDCR